MKKRYIIIPLLGVMVFSLSNWIIQPMSLNPFKKVPNSLTESIVQFDHSIDENYSLSFKSKADSILNNAILMNDFIGASSGVYKEGIGTWLGNAGFSNKQKNQRSNKNTVHRIASLSKPLTAVAIMQLYESGQIKLDESIHTYLPEFPKKSKGDITIRQLLNHTSGIKHYESNWDGISFTRYKTVIEALDEFKDRPLSFKPGTGYEYSTYGYTMLGAIIEKVSGLSYEEYMRTNIFHPASMKNTEIEDSKTNYPNKAELYIKLGSNYIRSPKTDLSVKAPGGGIHSTAADLLNFGKAILEHKLIDSTSLEMMIKKTHNLKQGTPYGFGWYILDDEKLGKVILHGGSQSGASANLQIALDQKIVSVCLANNFNSDGGVQWLSRELQELISDKEKIFVPVSYHKPQTKELLRSYIGKFKGGDKEFTIHQKNGQLYSQLNDYPSLPMFPKSNNEFFFRAFGSTVKFTRDMNGSLTLNYINGTDSLSCFKI